MKTTFAEPPDRRDPRPRCRCCGRVLTGRDPYSRALGVGPKCVRRMPASERGALVRAAWSAAKHVHVGTYLDATGMDVDEPFEFVAEAA